MQFPLDPNIAANAPNNYNLQPVAIDPMMVGASATYGPFPNANIFASDGNKLIMTRLTVFPIVSGATALAAPQQACMSEDDMSFTNSTTNADLLPTGGYNSIGTKREYSGRFTWLATLVPVYGDWQPTENRNLMNMSVVVFNQRQFQIAPSAQVPPSEHACQVTVQGSGFGGGDLTLSSSSANNVAVRVGECLMLGWMQKDIPTASGQAVTFSGSPSISFGTLTRPMFRWYRILNAGPATSSGGTWTRNITVAGPDLNLNTGFMVSGSVWAFIYDGAVAVYERTIRLEGPSMWTN